MILEEPLVLRTDRADGLTTLTLNRPAQFNSLSKDMLTAIRREVDDHRGQRSGARRRHRRRRQGLLRRS